MTTELAIQRVELSPPRDAFKEAEQKLWLTAEKLRLSDERHGASVERDRIYYAAKRAYADLYTRAEQRYGERIAAANACYDADLAALSTYDAAGSEAAGFRYDQKCATALAIKEAVIAASEIMHEAVYISAFGKLPYQPRPRSI